MLLFYFLFFFGGFTWIYMDTFVKESRFTQIKTTTPQAPLFCLNLRWQLPLLLNRTPISIDMLYKYHNNREIALFDAKHWWISPLHSIRNKYHNNREIALFDAKHWWISPLHSIRNKYHNNREMALFDAKHWWISPLHSIRNKLSRCPHQCSI